MKKLEIKDIIIKENIGYGNFSEVKKCIYKDKLYRIKFITRNYSKNVVSNIIKMTDTKFDKEYFTPLYILENETGYSLIYIMNYDETLKESFKIKDYNDKITFLKNTRKIIHKLHEDYKIIHGDLVCENMLYDENFNSFLIDFDSSIKFGSEFSDKQMIRIFVRDYLKYYPLDKNLDIYAFNITTLKLLGNYNNIGELFDNIESNKFNMFPNNKDVKKFIKELELKDTRKKYSGEYIIDYI